LTRSESCSGCKKPYHSKSEADGKPDWASGKGNRSYNPDTCESNPSNTRDNT